MAERLLTGKPTRIKGQSRAVRKNMNSGIYQIVNKVNGNSYVGQTNNFARRWVEHRAASRKKSTVLGRAFKKYGLDNFDFRIIERCPVEMLDEREKHYISAIKPEYNMNEGGVGNKGHIVKEEVRRVLSIKSKSQWDKMCDAQKQKVIKYQLIGPRMEKGHIFPKDIREKISAKLKEHYHGKTTSPLQKQRAREVNKVLLIGNKRGNKSVLQMDAKSGKVLTKFSSLKEAAAHVGREPHAITEVCKGRNKTCAGYKWAYAARSVETIPQGSRVEISTTRSTEQP